MQLKCEECGTLRCFKLDSSFHLLVQKDITAFKINTTCENCETEFSMTLAWNDKFSSFAYSEIIPTGEHIEIEDKEEMKEPDGSL